MEASASSRVSASVDKQALPRACSADKFGAFRSGGACAEQEPDAPIGCFYSAFARRVKDHAVVTESAGSGVEASPSFSTNGWETLPLGLLSSIFRLLHQQCADWPSSQSRFSAAGTCSAWRAASQEAFARMEPSLKTINHPSELFITRPYSVPTALLHCLVLRQKQAGGGTLYLMYLGEPDQDHCEKFLLSASHNSRFGGHRFVMNVSPAYNAAADNPNTIACLRTNVLGTSYNLQTLWDGGRGELSAVAGSTQEPSPPGHMGSMAYRRNFFGIRGPRRLHVHLPIICQPRPDECCSEAIPPEPQQQQEPAPVADVVNIPDPVKPSPGRISLQNVPPHWHEVLQCWCLNFGGRVKEASVKNFQLLDVQHPGSVAMQFGKVSTDRFILDFDPKKITPIQAFGVALSSFESKLPYQ